MNIFDLLIVQPIFNVLIAIYGLLPGGDFGVAVILLTVLIRLAMWPLVRKQLHQTKVMRDIQPALKKLKVRAKGNKQLEAQMMMELYRERGVNPFASIGLLLLQLPILIALYQVILIVTQQRDRIEGFAYNFLEPLRPIAALIDNPDKFNETLFGVVNLAQAAVGSNGVYWPILILAIAAAGLQYYQSRQITPRPEEGTRIRDIMRDQAAGKDVDQAELNAAISNKMLFVIPFITLFVSLYLPGALVLYFVASSVVAIIQQGIILRQDATEMDALADKPSIAAKPKQAKSTTPAAAKPVASGAPKTISNPGVTSTTSTSTVVEGEVIETATKQQNNQKRKKISAKKRKKR